MDRRNPMDRHGPRRKRNPRASRPPLIPSRKLASARKSIPPSVSSLSIQVTGKQSQKQQLMESIDSESSKASEIPQKHVLQCILDTLQRRDTYDIFAEPVDPNEVEDYYEFIKEPMDFGTMRAKLHEGMYQNLGQFKTDVFLITKNAMHFNSSATIYFRQARAIHEHAKRVFHVLETNPSKFEHTILGTRRRSSTKKARNDTTNGSINTNFPSNDKNGCSVSKSTLMPSNDQRNKKKLQGGGLNIDDNDNDDAHDARASFTHSNTCNPFLGTTDGKKMDNNSKIEESNRRCTYDRHCSPFFQADSNPFSVNSFKANSNPFAVNSFKPLVDVSYRESLLSFVNELGPKAKMVAARKLQSAALVDINGGGSGGAAAPGLLLRSFSLPTTTEPPPPPPPPPAPPQPQPTTSTATTRRSEMGGASSPGSFLRNYSLPLTTEPPPPPPPPHMPLPLRPQPTMTTTRRSEMGGAASPGLFLRNYSLPTTTTAEPPPPPPPPPQPQPTIAPTRRNEMREAAAGGVHCPNPTEENVRPVILALEHPHGNHALESGKAKSKRIGLHSTHNRSSDRGHSQAAVDSGQMQKKPKSSPPAATAAPSFPFDMCFLKAKLDRMIVEGSPVGRRGDSKFATGLQSWTGNRILADQRRFF